MKEPKLKELGGNSRLALGFFNSIIRRIEFIAAQTGVDNDATIGGGGGTDDFNEVTLNVCSNGVPSTITVLTRD